MNFNPVVICLEVSLDIFQPNSSFLFKHSLKSIVLKKVWIVKQGQKKYFVASQKDCFFLGFSFLTFVLSPSLVYLTFSTTNFYLSFLYFFRLKDEPHPNSFRKKVKQIPFFDFWDFPVELHLEFSVSRKMRNSFSRFFRSRNRVICHRRWWTLRWFVWQLFI